MSRTESVPLPAGTSDMGRIDYMKSLAQATGGKAYILNNLREEVVEAFDLSKSAYTLSYAPHEYANDGSWHDVSVRVDGPYQLSYRRGYLAVWNAEVHSVVARLLRTTGAGTTGSPGVESSKPLLFEVRTEIPSSGAERKPAGQLALTFSVAPDQLAFVFESGLWKDEIVVSSYAYDDRGNLKGGEQQEIDAVFTPEHWDDAKAKKIGTRQAFVVPGSAKYVLFVVRDKRSRRQGTLMLTTRALIDSR